MTRNHRKKSHFSSVYVQLVKFFFQGQGTSSDENNISTSSDGGDRNTDNLLQVISYLRREKNLANSQLETLLSENRRLKSETDLIKRQLEETRALLESEQEKTDISSTTAAKHAELINKVRKIVILLKLHIRNDLNENLILFSGTNTERSERQ